MHSLTFNLTRTISFICALMVAPSVFAAAVAIEQVAPAVTASIVHTLISATNADEALENIKLILREEKPEQVREILYEREHETRNSVFHLALRRTLEDEDFDKVVETLLHAEYTLLRNKKCPPDILSPSLTNNSQQTVTHYLASLYDRSAVPEDDHILKRITSVETLLSAHQQRCDKALAIISRPSAVRTLKYATDPNDAFDDIKLIFNQEPFHKVKDILSEQERQTNNSVFHVALKLASMDARYDRILKTLLLIEYQLLKDKKYLSCPLSLSLVNSAGHSAQSYLESLSNLRDEDERELCFDDVLFDDASCDADSQEDSFVRRVKILKNILQKHHARCEKTMRQKYQPAPSPQGIPTPSQASMFPFTWPHLAQHAQRELQRSEP